MVELLKPTAVCGLGFSAANLEVKATKLASISAYATLVSFVVVSFVLVSEARFRILPIRLPVNIAIFGENARKNLDFGEKTFFRHFPNFVRAFR